MPTNVNAAFTAFLIDTVNLDADTSRRARASRDWLVQQMQSLSTRHEDFPTLFPEVHIHYGSFARRTKTKELDDIDLIIGVSALGTTYTDSGGTVLLNVPDGITLRELCYDGTNRLNSRKVINRFIAYLNEIPQYQQADIKRNGAAAVLNLSSYTWSFDIVPGFFTTPELDGRTYYIIPDGAGEWMKTDPRIDQARTTSINQKHAGHVLDVIRLIKYWNRRPTMPNMGSYLIESIVLRYYESAANQASQYVDLEVAPLLEYIAIAVLGYVGDPKGIQGDINTLSLEGRSAISDRATSDARSARAAVTAESEGDPRESIRLWRALFGPAFPVYG